MCQREGNDIYLELELANWNSPKELEKLTVELEKMTNETFSKQPNVSKDQNRPYSSDITDMCPAFSAFILAIGGPAVLAVLDFPQI